MSGSTLLTRPVVGGSDCGRFTEPDAQATTAADPFYDPDSGETVDTVALVDERSLEALTEQVANARAAQIAVARRSVELASRADTADIQNIQATISFNRPVALGDVATLATTYGLRMNTAGHAFLGLEHLFVGEIPTVDPEGVLRSLHGIQAEYIANVRLQRGQVAMLVRTTDGSEPPSTDIPTIVTDVEARLKAAENEGIKLIGIVVEGTIQQVTAAMHSAEEFIANITPEGCEPQNAIVPGAWVPMIAHQLLDLPERNTFPMSVNSPVAEGR